MDYRDKKDACCEDWADHIGTIDAQMQMAQIQSAIHKYEGPRFRYCPFCGDSRTVESEGPIEQGKWAWINRRPIEDNRYDEAADFEKWKKWRRGWQLADKDTAIRQRPPEPSVEGDFTKP
jgi:hypothetical protein